MLITDAAVREAAAHLAQSLGGDWAIDAEAPADGAAHLIYSDGRGISFRPIFGGTTVQLWITGSAAPPLPDDATLADHALREAQLTARLAEGHRYNKATTLVTEADEDPELIILRTLEDDLLPAFDYKPRYVGHRPWIDLFDSALSQVMDEAPSATGTSLRDCGPEAHATPPDLGENAEFANDQQPENPVADEVQERDLAPADESDPEVARPPSVDPVPDSAPGSTATGKGSGDHAAAETSPTAKRRPRSRTPKSSSI